jgi:hypothetical protein
MNAALTPQKRKELIEWAEKFAPETLIQISLPVAKSLRNRSENFLRNYWSLSRTARNPAVDSSLRNSAHESLFAVRTTLERWMTDSVLSALRKGAILPEDLLDGTVFGCSLKQGVSFRLPLSVCQPTKQCAGGCYAHDGLDASISTVIRGAINGAFAQHYEESAEPIRGSLMGVFDRPLKKAITQSLNEARRSSYRRSARIRMSHVGELAAYPAFANGMASRIKELSSGKVACVIYTRHRKASLLDPSLFVINFTLDDSSLARRSWAPSSARIVYSAWDGKVRKDVEVNFLEHHHLAHSSSEGAGKVCPATQPAAKDKTCDGVMCDFCFKPHVPA